MSEPFERTTRYLTADGGRLALTGIGLGLILALVWLVWLFFGRVPLYVQSQSVQRGSDGTYSVTVDPTIAQQLKPNQRASLQAAAAKGANTPLLAASVASVDRTTGTVQMTLDDRKQQPAAAGARVWIESEQVSPATLIMRTIEQSFSAP